MGSIKVVTKILKNSVLMAVLVLSFLGSAQERLVVPGQELLYPHLIDPSFTGEEKRTQITAIGQFVDFNTDRATQYINAQLPIYDNLSFGLDYFKNKLDFYNYSQVILSTAFEIPIGETGHVRVGLAGGGESLKLDRVPTNQQSGTIIPNINENNIEFTYRVGLHYNNRNLVLGGYYATLPSQQVTVQEGQEDLLGYNLEDGLTGYLGYRIRLGQGLGITPMFRYLSYTDEAIYEGSMKLQFKEKFDIGLAYRNDYSINPAVRFQLFKSLMVGYSYEKALGNLIFEDIHSFSLAYKFNKANADEEPEWMETAKNNIEKTETLDKPKSKKPKKEANEEVVEKPTLEEEVLEEEVLEETGETVAADEVPETENTETPIVEEQTDLPTEEVEVEKTESRKPITKAVAIVMSSRYYVVGDSFDNYLTAYRFKEELKQNGFNALIGSVEGDEKYHVYIDSDYDKAEAEKRMEGYKATAILNNMYLLKAD